MGRHCNIRPNYPKNRCYSRFNSLANLSSNCLRILTAFQHIFDLVNFCKSKFIRLGDTTNSNINSRRLLNCVRRSRAFINTNYNNYIVSVRNLTDYHFRYNCGVNTGKGTLLDLLFNSASLGYALNRKYDLIH